jgi:hypothetical protein
MGELWLQNKMNIKVYIMNIINLDKGSYISSLIDNERSQRRGGGRKSESEPPNSLRNNQGLGMVVHIQKSQLFRRRIRKIIV